MLFTRQQIDMLFFRLRQTKEELLYDIDTRRVERYSLTYRGGKILGVAHCDFVEDAWSYPTFMPGDIKIRAGQVDDRVGVWLLLDVLHTLPGMPAYDILLTTDEEIGRSSAQEVAEDLEYNWTFQFDRRGTDFVDYCKASPQFLKDFKSITGIPHGIGSFSDICYLPSSCGSRVNIGTGYHNEHTPGAWVDLLECSSQVEKFAAFACKQYDQAYKMGARRKVKSKAKTKRYSPGGIWDWDWDYKVTHTSAESETVKSDDIISEETLIEFDTWE